VLRCPRVGFDDTTAGSGWNSTNSFRQLVSTDGTSLQQNVSDRSVVASIIFIIIIVVVVVVVVAAVEPTKVHRPELNLLNRAAVHCEKYPYIREHFAASFPYFNKTGSIYVCVRKSPRNIRGYTDSLLAGTR